MASNGNLQIEVPPSRLNEISAIRAILSRAATHSCVSAWPSPLVLAGVNEGGDGDGDAEINSERMASQFAKPLATSKNGVP